MILRMNSCFTARAALSLVLVWLSLGCAGNVIDLAILPEDLIAVRMWENEDARRRRDIVDQLEGSEGITDATCDRLREARPSCQLLR